MVNKETFNELMWWISLTPKQKDEVQKKISNTVPNEVLQCIDAMYKIQTMYKPLEALLNESDKLREAFTVLHIDYYRDFIIYLTNSIGKLPKTLYEKGVNPYIDHLNDKKGLLYLFGKYRVLEAFHFMFFGYYKPSHETRLKARVKEAFDVLSGDEKKRVLNVLKKHGINKNTIKKLPRLYQ